MKTKKFYWHDISSHYSLRYITNEESLSLIPLMWWIEGWNIELKPIIELFFLMLIHKKFIRFFVLCLTIIMLVILLMHLSITNIKYTFHILFESICWPFYILNVSINWYIDITFSIPLKTSCLVLCSLKVWVEIRGLIIKPIQLFGFMTQFNILLSSFSYIFTGN